MNENNQNTDITDIKIEEKKNKPKLYINKDTLQKNETNILINNNDKDNIKNTKKKKKIQNNEKEKFYNNNNNNNNLEKSIVPIELQEEDCISLWLNTINIDENNHEEDNITDESDIDDNDEGILDRFINLFTFDDKNELNNNEITNNNTNNTDDIDTQDIDNTNTNTNTNTNISDNNDNNNKKETKFFDFW